MTYGFNIPMNGVNCQPQQFCQPQTDYCQQQQQQQQCYIPQQQQQQSQQCYIPKAQDCGDEFISDQSNYGGGGGGYQDEGQLDQQLLNEIDQYVRMVCGKPRCPQVRRKIIHASGSQGKVLTIRRRCPTPQPDVIEKIKIVHPGPDTVKLIVEKPDVPPPIVKTKTVVDKKIRPNLVKKVVCVPPSGRSLVYDYCQPQHQQDFGDLYASQQQDYGMYSPQQQDYGLGLYATQMPLIQNAYSSSAIPYGPSYVAPSYSYGACYPCAPMQGYQSDC